MIMDMDVAPVNEELGEKEYNELIEMPRDELIRFMLKIANELDIHERAMEIREELDEEHRQKICNKAEEAGLDLGYAFSSLMNNKILRFNLDGIHYEK